VPFVAAIALLVAATSIVVAQGNVDQGLLSALTAPNQGFPAIALTIDGQSVPGLQLARAVAMGQANAAEAGKPFDRRAAIEQEIDRLVLKAAVAREMARRGYTASDAEVTAFLTQQGQEFSAQAPAQWAALLQADGLTNLQSYIDDPLIRDAARQMLAGRRCSRTYRELIRRSMPRRSSTTWQRAWSCR
jgi:hypothetical protein